MKTSLHTTIRRTGLVLVAAMLAIAVAGPAQGSTGQSVPPQSAIDAASANWAAKAKLLDAYGGLQFDRIAPVSAIDAASANWAAKANLLDAYGRPQSTVSPQVTSGTFHWGDFGIGTAAMLGLVLLLAGVAAGIHYGRRTGVRPRPAS